MRRYSSKPGRGTLAVLAAVVLSVTWLPPAQAATPPSLGDFVLEPVHKSPVDLPERVERLDDELPKLGVQNILATANRTAVQSATTDTCNPDALDSMDLHGLSYCFNDSDSSVVDGTVEWMPQGITTVADAQQDQLWGSKKAILISWYDKSPEDGGQSGGNADETKGCRITFLDPETLKYRHVLLVYPTINSYDNPSYMTLRTTQYGTEPSLHCGGMTWYGNYLYVADTAKGFRVFDMRYIFDLTEADNGNTSDKSQVGRRSGVYYGHGYRFVMPEVGAWRNTGTRKKCSVDGAASFSFVGLDRSGVDHLTTGEYCSGSTAGGDPDKMGRVARWPLDGSNGKPQLTDGLWRADAAYRLPTSNIQGALSYNGTWYLSRSRGKSANGVLYETEPVSGTTGTLEIETAHYAGVGVEDFSHWPGSGGSPGTLWTVTEHPGRRMIYACDLQTLGDVVVGGEICGEWPDAPG